ncbi:MAG: MiaB/RimO family radical SAM methylthiotransferase [Gemmatimonadetes bacterium]|nr:MiaB/RimO family radical SAM methylthiotransferase [Gemmatimonadota bacterium]
MRVYYHTFGCKANQYDTERMRQEAEARGAETVGDWSDAQVCVVNTCTVTNQADAAARRLVRRVRRENPGARIVVAGCSAALRAPEYEAMEEVASVVPGHDPVAVASRLESRGLVQLGVRRPLDRSDHEPVGAELLREREGATRGWLKVQDGCDRKCSFCATRLARGTSRSRSPDEVVAEARLLARTHPELVVTGIHIGHYGRDLVPESTLARLLARLLDEVPDVRFRLGSVEATEIDDLLLDLMTSSGGRVAPHLHMPLQSGADPVLRRMRRWHTRGTYRRRALEIAERLPVLGLGADVITGFPGETEEDHTSTVALVEELPFTYLHVFPFSPREGTVAAAMNERDPVPQRVAGERSRELRERVQAKGLAYRASRAGALAEVALEGRGGSALTGDYLRVRLAGGVPGGAGRLHRGVLGGTGDDLYIDLPRADRSLRGEHGVASRTSGTGP